MFARPFDPKWKMPDLDGPEYRQTTRESGPTIWPQPGRRDNPRSGRPVEQALEYRLGRDDTEKSVLPAGAAHGGQGNGGKDAGLTSIDPLGMFPQYGAQNLSSGQQTDNAPTVKHPQYLWDEHIWKSPEVISAQTPKEKREAVNRVLAERQGEFDSAYKSAYGDKAAERWKNDKRFTLGAMGDYVSADQLRAFGWRNVDDNMVKDLNNTLIRYDITTPARIRHFLAQCTTESKLGKSTTELYNGDPYEYFEKKYGKSLSLGNTTEGDGYKYRGGGYIQLTGKNNYKEFRDEVHDDDVLNIGAEHVAKKYPWMASAFWWHKLNSMNDLVDTFNDTDADEDVKRVTRTVTGEPDWDDPQEVNRWLDSLKERQEHYKRSRGIFPD